MGKGFEGFLDTIERALGGDPDKQPTKKPVIERRKTPIVTPRAQGGTTYRDGKVYDAQGKEIKDFDGPAFFDPTAKRV
jgi:hypothetical protein